jgi:hypothetical protein
VAFLAGLFLKVFTGSTLSFVSNILQSLTSEHVAIVQAQTGLAATETKAVVDAEIARQNMQGNIIMAMMNHPVFWIAWSLLVLGTAGYDFAIHFKSIGCAFATDAQACNRAWVILAVPKEISDWDHYVILFFFGLGAASSIVTSITRRI